LRATIFASRDAADLKDRLAVLLQDADPSAFATTLERAMIAADVLGYLHADR
jgi:phage gp29-like protein